MKKGIKLVFTVLMIISVMALGFTACAKEAPPAPVPPAPAPAPPKPAPPKPAPPEVVNIGMSSPLSGGAAKYGKNNVDGVTLAIEEINAAGGITVAGKKYTFKLTAVDDRYKPAETVSNARRMLTTLTPKPPVIFCPHSGGILAMEKFNEEEGFLIQGYTDNPKILEAGNKLVMKDPASMAYYIYSIMGHGWELGCRKAAQLSGTHEAGVMAQKIFDVQWKDKGGEIVAEAPADYGKVTDFYPYLTKVLAAKPDAIFLYGPSEPSAMIVTQSRELGFDGWFLCGAQCKPNEMVKVAPDITKLVTVSQYTPMLPEMVAMSPEIPKWKERCKAYFGADYVVTSENLMNYEAMYIVAEAMKVAGTVTDARKIRAALPEVFAAGEAKGYPYPQMRFYGITPEGQLLSRWFAVEVIDGKIVNPFVMDFDAWLAKYKKVTWMPD